NSLWDQLYISLNQNANNNADNYDGAKLYNSHLDFYSYSADSARLCVDARPFDVNGIIPLGIATDVDQAYIIKTDLYDIPGGTQLILHDKYLGTYTTLGLGVSYPFDISSDPSSQGDNRFELGMSGVLNVNKVSSNDLVNISPNPATDKVTVSYKLQSDEEV